MQKIPISVVIATKNEAKNIARCLEALADFAEVLVVDSNSTDQTVEIARHMGVRVESFTWNGRYPKKRQWILETIPLAHDWVFWVDADEVVTPELAAELRELFLTDVQNSGFFVRGRYVWHGKVLRYGMKNNKIALMHRGRMAFPVVEDLDVAGMGEMEGHYQPVLKNGGFAIGQIKASLLHYAQSDPAAWTARHERYAVWEAEMTRRGRWPVDPVQWRERIKSLIRSSVFRPWIMFFYSYIAKAGFLDGDAGLDFALSRKRYCAMILEKYRNTEDKNCHNTTHWL